MTPPPTAPWKPGAPAPTPQLPDYPGHCFAVAYPARLGRAVHCSWEKGPDHPDWHVAADVRGRVTHVWETGIDLPDGRFLSPADTPPLGFRDGETPETATDRCAREGGALGIRRQCSIGYHAECSSPTGDNCTCACHVLTEEAPPPLWTGPDEGDGPVELVEAGAGLRLESDTTSLLDLTRDSAVSLGLALLRWAPQCSVRYVSPGGFFTTCVRPDGHPIQDVDGIGHADAERLQQL